jgi:hypothetical protein
VDLTDLRLIREQLALVRNARGATDLVKIEAELSIEARGPARLDRSWDLV